jgi:hypothetical protein
MRIDPYPHPSPQGEPSDSRYVGLGDSPALLPSEGRGGGWGSVAG